MSVGQVQDVGLRLFISLIQASAGRPKFVGWGTGSGADPDDVDLVTPSAEARTNGTTTIEDENITDDTYRIVAQLETLSDQAITEIGVFDAAGSGSPAVGGNMAFYSSFPPLSIEEGDTITFTTDVTLVRAP